MLLIFLILLCKIKGVLIKLRYQSSDYDPKGQYKRHGILCLQHCAYSFYSKLSKHAFTYIQLSKFSLFLSPKKKKKFLLIWSKYLHSDSLNLWTFFIYLSTLINHILASISRAHFCCSPMWCTK